MGFTAIYVQGLILVTKMKKKITSPLPDKTQVRFLDTCIDPT